MSADALTLRQLCRVLGMAPVAQAMGISERNLEDLRAGRHPLTVDHLYSLDCEYGERFAMVKTVREVGGIRLLKKRAKRSE